MRLIINGFDIELAPNVSIAKTLQVNDIGSVSTRQASYTNTFSIPKTANNIKALNYLSIEGNTSNVPYQKNEAYLYSDSGECLVYKGWAVISETSKTFKCNIYDGIVDLYKRIENKTLADLDLAEIQHEKTPSNIVSSQDLSKPYVYLIADYNGKAMTGTNLCSDYLVPSIKVSWLLEKIQEFTGFTFNGSFKTNPDFTNLFLTQPKASPPVFGTVILNSTDLASDRTSFNAIDPVFDCVFGVGTTLLGGKISIDPTDRTKLIANETVIFKATFNVNPNISLVDSITGEVTILYAQFNNNTILCDGYTQTVTSFVTFNKGSVYRFGMRVIDPGYTYTETIPVYDWFVNAEFQELENKGIFEKELQGLQIKDFINELLWRFNLTIFKDKYTNSYIFKYLNEILNTPAIDWSDKFNGLESENYIYGSYGQTNYLKYAYNDPKSNWADGQILINNANLPPEKTIIQSITLAPEYNPTNNIGLTTQLFKFWDKQVKDNGTIEYKTLSNRYYLMRASAGVFSPYKTLKSDVTLETAVINNYQLGLFSRLEFEFIKDEYYSEMYALLNQSKVLSVTMRLTENDIVDMDFSKPVYIKQLGGSFLVNKINNFIPYKNTKVELIKINR